jgi:hypothetical protein
MKLIQEQFITYPTMLDFYFVDDVNSLFIISFFIKVLNHSQNYKLLFYQVIE